MSEKSHQIEQEIREKRSQIGENSSELEPRVKHAVDWRAQFEERPATLTGLAFGGGIVISALLPTRHSRHRSRDSYDDDSCRNNRIQRRLAQERIAQDGLRRKMLRTETPLSAPSAISQALSPDPQPATTKSVAILATITKPSQARLFRSPLPTSPV
jgi:hypothetical protein